MNEVVEVRMASWKAMVQERNASGLSIKEWCAANNVSESQYYYRLRQLRNTALAAAGQGICYLYSHRSPVVHRWF